MDGLVQITIAVIAAVPVMFTAWLQHRKTQRTIRGVSANLGEANGKGPALRILERIEDRQEEHNRLDDERFAQVFERLDALERRRRWPRI